MVFLSGKRSLLCKQKEYTSIKGDLEYKIKTIMRILPEYELYHQLYGIPKQYDLLLLEKIKLYQLKKYSLNKIKYNLKV